MARIRTIKPEFPQSESMGRVSREARLCFVMLWTLADDSGRLRGNSRMLASLLFPYDDDAAALIDGWLSELATEGCVTRYEIEGHSYIQIDNWLEHQKIDKPSQSKIPPFSEASRTVAKPREPSSLDQEGKGRESIKDREGTNARSADADDLDAAFEAYNLVAEELSWPKAQALTPKRRAALKARLSEVGGLSGWRAAMAKARASPFLRGDSGRDKAHEKWVPDLDFFLQQSAFTKLMEGKYDDRQGSASIRSAHDTFLAAAASI